SLAQGLLSAVKQRIGLVTLGDQLTAAVILIGVHLSITDHLLDLFVAQARRSSDGDMLYLACRLIGSCYVHNTIGVEVESYFDLWYTTWCCWNAIEYKLTKRFVQAGLGALTLQHVYFYTW